MTLSKGLAITFIVILIYFSIRLLDLFISAIILSNGEYAYTFGRLVIYSFVGFLFYKAIKHFVYIVKEKK